MASTYSGLKVAQVMEAAIPISILAVGVSGLFKRRNSILENVIIQSIGGASGLIVAGSIFTLPALYIMNVAPGTLSMLLTIFIVSVLGACLGLLFLIPLRRYFVVEQHGKLPFPEATAINEVYVTGEKGGEQAKTLVVAACVGGVYDFLAVTVRAWNEIVNFRFLPLMEDLATKFKATISVNAISLIVGLGYITGLRFSAIICAGGFFSALILVPLIYHFGQHIPALAIPPSPLPGFTELHPRHERQPDLPPLRPAHRRGRHGGRRDHRHHPGAAHHRQRVLARLPADLPSARPRRPACRAPTATSR